MKGMNNIIADTQDRIEVIAGKLHTVLRTKERIDQLDAKMCSYMDQGGTLDFAKDQLDRLVLDLVVDLDGVILEALSDIEADEEEEVDAYAAMFAEDDLPEEGPDSQEPKEIEQEGGAE